MSRIHREVQAVLVGTGNQAILTAGNDPGDLASGQFGVFTPAGTSIVTGTTATEFRVGVKTSDGVRFSKGFIKGTNVKSVALTCFVDAAEKVVDLTNICTQCGGEYAIRMDIYRSEANVSYGFAPFLQSFTYTSDCCTTPGEDVSCITMLQSLRDAINAGQGSMFTALVVDPETLDLDDSGELDDEALADWDTDANGCPVLRIRGSIPDIEDFCNIPNKYAFPTGITFEVSLSGADCCSPAVTIETVQDLAYPNGAGVDIKYAEWMAAGNDKTGPYRQTETGIDISAALNASTSVDYVQLDIEYVEPIESGFREYSDPKWLKIAVPTTATSTDNLFDALEALLGTELSDLIDAC